MSSGIKEKILETKVQWTAWVEQTWITFLQKALWEIEGAITTDIKWYKAPRENDQFLMDIFSNQGYNKNKLRAINRCRIYLRVITLSDIGTYDGKTICPEI